MYFYFSHILFHRYQDIQRNEVICMMKEDLVGDLIDLLENVLTVETDLSHSNYTDEEIKKAKKRMFKELKLLKKGKISKSKYLTEEAKDLYDEDDI